MICVPAVNLRNEMQWQKAKHKQQMVGLMRSKSNRCLFEDGERGGDVLPSATFCGAAQSDSEF